MELERKTTLLLSPALHDRLTRLARHRRTSMGALIREAVEAHYGLSTREERLAAVEALSAIGAPVATPAEMKAESVETVAEQP